MQYVMIVLGVLIFFVLLFSLALKLFIPKSDHDRDFEDEEQNK